MPYKEGDKWRAKVQVGGIRKTALVKTKKEAKEWEQRTKRKLRNAKNSPPGLDLLTFCSEYTIYAERYSDKTYREKKSLCERIVKAWGKDTPAAQITPDLVQSYLSLQAAERSNHASNRDRKNLLAMFGWGIRFGKIPSNPVSRTDRLPHDRAPQYTPPTDDVLAVLAAADRKHRVILYAYIFTGARRSEIFRWTWADDINLAGRKYRLGTRKTKDGSMHHEWFPMPVELHGELSWWWQNRSIRNSPFVFCDDQTGPHHGKPYKARRRFMRGLCKRAGVKSFGFHALRRFFASRLADDGKSTNTIRRLLRHQHVNTTERYIQNINDDLEGVASGILTVESAVDEARDGTE